MKRSVLVACGLLAVSCVQSRVVNTSPVVPQDADAYVRNTALPAFTRAFNAARWDDLAALYTDDAVLLAPHSEIARGRAEVRRGFASFAPMKPNITLNPERVVQSCDLAYEYGTYEMRLTPPGSAQITDRGKYVTIWRRMPNGEWKISGDIFNTSLPM